jgi:hypothetical protein
MKKRLLLRWGKLLDKCSICNNWIEDDEAILEWYFGDLSVCFCEFCFLSVLDMAEEHFVDNKDTVIH